jgi:hypothetical protein
MPDVELRRCIGSARFGIEPHEAPINAFPAQPSQKDGLGRMCATHWRAYTAGLARDARARKAPAEGVVTARPLSQRRRRPSPRPGVTGRRPNPLRRTSPACCSPVERRSPGPRSGALSRLSGGLAHVPRNGRCAGPEACVGGTARTWLVRPAAVDDHSLLTLRVCQRGHRVQLSMRAPEAVTSILSLTPCGVKS